MRRLVEFAWRAGDLRWNRERSGPLRAWQGMRVHRELRRNRPEGFQAEVPVTCRVEREEWVLEVQGRIDGFWEDLTGPCFEEIKSVEPGWAGEPDPLHWAQVTLYAAMALQDRPSVPVELRLVYATEAGVVRRWERRLDSGGLRSFLQATLEPYLQMLERQHAWRVQRNAALRGLGFPHPAFRAGQRRLAVAGYRAMLSGGRLFVEAPTGIGKTISLLFPALKAMGGEHLDRIVYVTPRDSAKQLAEENLERLRQHGARIRSLTLTAREKICRAPGGGPCDRTDCPRFQGHWDRLRPALLEWMGSEALTRAGVEALAHRHGLCPYELSMEGAEWSDLVICDYNYVFDPEISAGRSGLEAVRQEAVLLVDEAHQLLERGREMHSAALGPGELEAWQEAIPKSARRCRLALRQAHKALEAARAAGAGPGSTCEPGPEWLEALERFVVSAEAWMAGRRLDPEEQAILEAWFGIHRWLRLYAGRDASYRTFLDPEGRFHVFCVDPAAALRQVHDAYRAAVFFSATLRPLGYYRAALGGAGTEALLELPSPYPPDHLAVLHLAGVDVRYGERSRTAPDVAWALLQIARSRPGNYLAFFPSYEHLETVLPHLREEPGLNLLVQTRAMDEASQRAFLARFDSAADPVLGLAVLGGSFAEGIDLVGERLVGVAVIGVGLPRISAEREAVRDYHQERGEDGFLKAYAFPGMIRVAQAAGRLIRSESDRGVVLLLDERFAQPAYRNLLPPAWQVRRVDRGGLVPALQAFWSADPPGDSGDSAGREAQAPLQL